VPANLSPEYKSAQEDYRRARDPTERLECLRQMLRTIPKHKGTEHLQADIRTRIKELTEELSSPRKGGARGGPSVVVRAEGAAQVALLGPPNVGKSSLHARLTGSHAAVGPYPLTTRLPLPGMLPHQDVQFQVVDLPPVTADFMEPWMPNALQGADAALLVVDLGAPDCVDEVAELRERLDEKGVSLLSPAPPGAVPSARPGAGSGGEDETLANPFRIRLPTLLLANKADRLADPEGELEVFGQLAGLRFPSIAVSAETGHGLAQIGPLLFAMLDVVRVYTKVPGHTPARDRPFTLRGGATVREVALLVHRGRAAELKFARLWGSGKFDGEQVSAEHPLRDGDVVELHW
jgi:ribosome-interacting GTPase 1